MPIRVDAATRPEDYALGRQVFTDYAKFLGLDLEFQGFTKEMDTLSTMYGPPSGCLLLARKGAQCIGGVGLRRLEPGVAEMKRMFVQPAHQGSGAGKALMEALLDRARALGYHTIRLDSVASLTRALALYRMYGFVETAPYCYNPFPDAVFLERRLT